MKKILQIILLTLFAANYSFGQTFTEVQDSLFQHLNKENITTGVLYDRVYSWAELTIPKDENIPIDYSLAKQTWLEMELARYRKRNIQA